MTPLPLTRRCLLGASAAIALVPSAVPEPEAYRRKEYRGATPATLNGKPALSTSEAERLWRAGGAIFIDTLAQPPRPPGLRAGTLWRPKPRDDIPGSVWLADSGYGELAPVMQAWFAEMLNRVTGGKRNRTLVFYCLGECWMSWNAAKRAASLGYTNVLWYRDGTDGWAAAGLPMERREPAGRPPQ